MVTSLKKVRTLVAKDKAVSSADARERARQVASKQAKTNTKGGSGWIKATVALLVVAIVAIIAIVMVNSKSKEIDEAGPVPASANQYGGITLAKDGIIKDSSDVDQRDFNSLYDASASATPSDSPTATPLPLGLEDPKEAKKNGDPVKVIIFQDFNCPHCGEFETEYGDEIQKLVDDGKITVEFRNLTFMDGGHPGEYSARTANAAYAVANQVSVDDYLNWQRELFSKQGTLLKNQEIIDLASKYGADIKDDMDNDIWRPLVKVVTAESSKNGVHGTPSIYADGQLLETKDFSTWINKIISEKKKK